MSESEHSTIPDELDESKDISEKHGSHHIKKKGQSPKQKSHSSKRGVKRNFKVPSSMAKRDSYYLNLGASIFGSACEGNNFFVLYGLKHDIKDVTKLMDVPSLDELLRGTFDCPSLSKDKRKKTSNISRSFLNSVGKACSLLQLPKSAQSQNSTEIDGSFYKKISTSQMSSVCAVESISSGDKEQSFTSDMSACHKGLYTENECLSSPLDFPLYQPKDVLERITLPPSLNLESLLLDVSKLAVPTKNSSNLRSGKKVSRQPSLPSFPWSHVFGTHSRINSDTVKLSTNRSTCQGKWARIGVISSFTDIDRGCFTNLESFSYDQSLVPSTASSNNQVCPSLFANLPFCQWNSSSPVTHSKDSEATTDAHCSRLLEAAQTLSEIASYSPRRNPYGIIRLQKKISHKTMKGKSFKSTVKLEEMPSPTSVVGSNPVAKSVDRIIPSKKPRVSVVENKDDVRSKNAKKGPCTRPSSKSSTPLPSKSVRDLVREKKYSTASILKEFTKMHPADRIFNKNKAYVGQFIPKLELKDWKRGKDK
ncbi:hypothetical protein Fmac_002009 [Flemingia macrophylla]|uniref:Uncharacterized protein n=1 Tax=Flemingia macrophylla TaxID=520843 RepID=A0ABD1NIR0_9FABA